MKTKVFLRKLKKTKSIVFWVLAVVLIALNLLGDLLELFITLVSFTGIGLVTVIFNFVIDPVIGGVTFLILIIMGGLEFRSLAKRLIVYGLGLLAEFIPGIDVLPLRTITLIVAIILMVREDAIQEKKERQEEREQKELSEEEQEIVQI